MPAESLAQGAEGLGQLPPACARWGPGLCCRRSQPGTCQGAAQPGERAWRRRAPHGDTCCGGALGTSLGQRAAAKMTLPSGGSWLPPRCVANGCRVRSVTLCFSWWVSSTRPPDSPGFPGEAGSITAAPPRRRASLPQSSGSFPADLCPSPGSPARGCHVPAAPL